MRDYQYEEAHALEFLNQNMHNNYPIKDDCIVVSEDGTYLPSSFLVDCRIDIACEPNVNSGLDITRFFVSAVNHYSGSVQVIISYQPENDTAFPCASSSAIVYGTQMAMVNLTPAAGIPEGAEWDPLRNLTGALWIGNMVGMDSIGSLTFLYENAAINPVCIVKNLIVTQIVEGLTVVDINGQTHALTGDVVLKAGDGIKFVYDQLTNRVTMQVDEEALSEMVAEALDAVDMAGYKAIRTINSAHPDSKGNLTIAGLDCTTIGAAQNGITISNPCSKPCCGDDSGDVADIKIAQQSVKDQVDRLTQNINALIISLNNVETRLPSLVASRK